MVFVTIRGARLRHFGWLCEGAIPPESDLRLRGWRMVERCVPGGAQPIAPWQVEAPVLLADARRVDTRLWLALIDPTRAPLRRRVLLTDVPSPAERGDLLRMGFGDVTAPACWVGELAARAQRIDEMAGQLPRQRRHGPLRLDLIAREAFAGGQPLGLHPREFALLWRLLDQPGHAIDKATLLREVWHLKFQPETNSLAVHVSRLRAKLALAGLGHLVQTDGAGGYRLAMVPAAAPVEADPAEPVLERATWKTVLPWEP